MRSPACLFCRQCWPRIEAATPRVKAKAPSPPKKRPVPATVAETGWEDYGQEFRNNSQQAKKRDGFKCQLCGRAKGDKEQGLYVPQRVQLNAHHRIRRKAGGPDELWNLVTLCEDCHHQIQRRAYRLHRQRTGDDDPPPWVTFYRLGLPHHYAAEELCRRVQMWADHVGCETWRKPLPYAARVKVRPRYANEFAAAWFEFKEVAGRDEQALEARAQATLRHERAEAERVSRALEQLSRALPAPREAGERRPWWRRVVGR